MMADEHSELLTDDERHAMHEPFTPQLETNWLAHTSATWCEAAGSSFT